MIKKLFKLLMGEPEGFVSEEDKFLNKFDADHPQKSASQQAEIEKHKIIAEQQ
tara:strand:- start:24823 stop:24981 length:159 start_codon:yes stop_codon:yes gene_type:complete